MIFSMQLDTNPPKGAFTLETESEQGGWGVGGGGNAFATFFLDFIIDFLASEKAFS